MNHVHFEFERSTASNGYIFEFFEDGRGPTAMLLEISGSEAKKIAEFIELYGKAIDRSHENITEPGSVILANQEIQTIIAALEATHADKELADVFKIVLAGRL